MNDYTAQEEEAARLPRDKSGHFMKAKQANSGNFITSLFKDNVSVSKSQGKTDDETLVDIHVNNPLHKIVELLKDIKKQKAFSFTLKGSVGIVGVAVVLVGGGILGGSRIVCNKGTQARIGEVHVLAYSQPAVSSQPIRDKIKALFGKAATATPVEAKWVILVDSGNNAIRLLAKSQTYLEAFAGHTVTAVGDLNSCNQELTVLNEGLEDF